MYSKRLLIILASIFYFALAGNAQKISPRALKQKGNEFYESKKYGFALPYLLKYQDAKPKDIETKLKIAVCYFETNRTEQAETYLEYLRQQKKPKAKVYWYMARTYHMQHRWKEAIQFYKKYLSTLDTKDNQKFVVKDEIRRCAKGIKLDYSNKLALVENLGDKVNTSGDDFGPVTNPQFNNILYFSSIRSENYGDRQNDFGIVDTIKGKYRADIFETKLDLGSWGLAKRLKEGLNTPAHDVIYDFDKKGELVYFGISRYRNFDYNNVYSKPFFEEKSIDIPFKFPIEINSGEWDADAYFFNDSIVVFSSDRPGGFGGKDIYISFRTKTGKWGEAINMGKAINTPYDEITPFLAKDGQSIYFSSNSVQGMGGYDIYRTNFNVKAGGWSKAHNMGTPINSAGNDSYFKISSDGMRAYYASSRAEGYGGYDIMVAYFRRLIPDQINSSALVAFKDYVNGKKEMPAVAEVEEDPGEVTLPPIPDKPKEKPKSDIPRFVFSPLFYQDYRNLLLKPESVKELNKMRDLLQLYTKLKIELTSHTDSYGPQNFNLQNSVGSAESIAEYLIANGITADRIIIKGVGQLYPIAQDSNDDGSENRQGRTLNRRIHMEVYGEENIPIIATTEIPDISSRLSSPEGSLYEKENAELTYRVQVKALKQMLDDDVLVRYPDALIETKPNVGIMRYSVGLVETFEEADKLRLKLVGDGFKDAFIVAYINGQRMDKADLSKFTTTYPNLTIFLEK